MKDILLNTDLDLDIANGDFVVGISDGQNQELIVVAQPGEFKQFPDATVGIERFLNDGEIDDMVAEVRAKFTADGMTVDSISFNEQTGKLDYDANY